MHDSKQNSLARSRSAAVLVALATVGFTASAAADSVSLEIVSQRASQITAPQEWLQLLRRAGVASARVRGARGAERPSIESVDGRGGRVHLLVGVLTDRDELVLPGGRFRRRDEAELRDYFGRLKADGAEAVTEATGSYGLTKRQFEAVFASLSRPLLTPTAGRAPEAVVDAARDRLAMRLVVNRSAATRLRSAEPLTAELKSLTIGTALAITLWGEGLALVPQKPLGAPVELRVKSLTDDNAEADKSWPVGYKAKGAPRGVAPDLMQAINVEIDGFTLAEAAAAIIPRLETPVVWDRHALAQHGVDPAAIDVRLPKAKLSYKRILEKLLFQARLRGELRTDEAGAPFYRISR